MYSRQSTTPRGKKPKGQGQTKPTKEQTRVILNLLSMRDRYIASAEKIFKEDIVVDETLVNHIHIAHAPGNNQIIDIVYCSDHRGFTNHDAFDKAIKYIVLRVYPEFGQKDIKFKLEVVKVKGLQRPLQAVKSIQYKALVGRINTYLELNQVTMCAALEGVWY